MRPVILAAAIAVIVLFCSTATAATPYLVQPAPAIYMYMPPAAVAYPPPVVMVPTVEVPFTVARPAVIVAPPAPARVYHRGLPWRADRIVW